MSGRLSQILPLPALLSVVALVHEFCSAVGSGTLHASGGVTERTNVTVSKTVGPLGVPRVQIPPPPPSLLCPIWPCCDLKRDRLVFGFTSVAARACASSSVSEASSLLGFKSLPLRQVFCVRYGPVVTSNATCWSSCGQVWQRVRVPQVRSLRRQAFLGSNPSPSASRVALNVLSNSGVNQRQSGPDWRSLSTTYLRIEPPFS
jgi:hypothetical protein